MEQNPATETTFRKLLELQLIPGDAQARLIATLSTEKKEQMIAMHASLLSDANAASKSRWTAADDKLLSRLDLDALHTRLATANRDFQAAFVRHDGLSILARAAETEPEGAIRCLTRVANNAQGLRALVASPALDAVARSVELAPDAVRILGVAVWAAETPAVLAALRRYSESRREPPFAWAARCVSADTLLLCNQLIMKTPDLEQRVALRNAMLAAGVTRAATGDVFPLDAHLAREEDVEMRGELMAVKQRDATVNRMAKAFGSKATKHREFVLRDGRLTWPSAGEGVVRMDEVVEVRPCSTNSELRKSYAIELAFAPPRPPLVLGVDTQAEHEAWCAAFNKARKQRKKKKQKNSSEESPENEAALRKQLDVFRAVADADREMTVFSQVDGADPETVATLIIRAASRAGAQDVALRLLHELLCWPVDPSLGAAGAWRLALRALAYTRHRSSIVPELRDEDAALPPSAWTDHALELDKFVAEAQTNAPRFEQQQQQQQKPSMTRPPPKEVGKYMKMLDVHVPLGAVEQKMRADGIDPGWLKGEPPSTPPSSKDGNNPKECAKYVKMLNMHLPREAVEQKMRADGVDPSILDADPTKPAPEDSTTKPATAKVLNDPKYAKYFKMLEMHLPRGAVEQKMRADGLDPSVLDGGGQTEAAGAAKVLNDPKYAKYFKMLEMHLPRGAVEQKMRADGLDPSVLDGGDSNPREAATASKKPEGIKLKGLFWTKVVGVEGTIWADLGETPRVDVKRLEATYASSSKGGGANKKNLRPQQKVEKEESVNLIDGKRKQNVLIGLGRVKQSLEEIGDALRDLALPELGSASGVELWLQLVPTEEEVSTVATYCAKHDASKLGKVERFFDVVRRKVPRVRFQLSALASIRKFDELASDLEFKTSLVADATTQLDTCAPLRPILCATLAIGNRMNQGTARGEALGFDPEALPKLATIKASDGTTLMHFVASTVDVALEDLNAVRAATRVDLAELAADLRRLEASTRIVEHESTKEEEEGAFASIARPFVVAALSRLEAAKAQLDATQAAGESLCERLGARQESPEDGGCRVRKLFVTFRDFSDAYIRARAENLKALARNKKQNLPQTPPPPPRKSEDAEDVARPTDNLFSALAASQTMSTDEIVANFQHACQKIRKCVADDEDNEWD
ncbi:hypothetical protein CTAYLR_004267 [Chrysophaeum taylorii]|uniref:FH2 domain-containing protein n=1 Tax=Chrysophaeum taylorii TaxID=2483200 RepID=A0AAD7UDU0_9STRA|nr:hypothetical protein CTAYLR_004267 [Chrysophaeum taylorii]